MGLFKHRQPQPPAAPPHTDDDPEGLARAALSLGLRPVEGNPLQPGPSDLVERMCWILYGRRYAPASQNPGTTISYKTLYRDAYAGLVGERRVVVANAWTNIGAQHVVRLLETTGVAVCAVEVGSVSPLLLAQPNGLPALGVHPVPTGDAALDERFDIVPAPGVGPADLTADVRRRLLAHDDWAFVGDSMWTACVSRGPFRSGDEVERRLDEVLGLLEAFPARVVPRRVDRSVDDLAARIDQIESLEDALRFLQGLTPGDRERLARSDTPLALFADVATPEQAMARFQSLDVPQRMQLMAMFQRAQGR